MCAVNFFRMHCVCSLLLYYMGYLMHAIVSHHKHYLRTWLDWWSGILGNFPVSWCVPGPAKFTWSPQHTQTHTHTPTDICSAKKSGYAPVMGPLETPKSRAKSPALLEKNAWKNRRMKLGSIVTNWTYSAHYSRWCLSFHHPSKFRSIFLINEDIESLFSICM